MSSVRFEELGIDDQARLAAVLALNNAAVPATSELDESSLTRLVAMCQFAIVVMMEDDSVGGFCLTFLPDADYASLNYRWFAERYELFSYLDRIVVREDLRNGGLGAAIYAELERRMAGVVPWLFCEVNVKPLNAASLRFHHRIGFVEVGQQDTERGTKRVSLLAKRLQP